jgi:4'-phosphopantetheinyl transferase
MPLEKLVKEGNRAWALWKVTESESQLASHLHKPEQIPEAISNEQKRLEYLTGRVLTQVLLEAFALPYNGVVKDIYGKPFPRSYPFQLSLSHSYPYVAALLDQDNIVGIDLEQPKEKLLRVAARVLSPSENNDAGTDVTKHCVYWCAKETLIKVYGKKDLVLAENLHIEPFTLAQSGHISGRIIVFNTERLIPLYYEVFSGFVLVLSLRDERPDQIR